VEVGKFYWRGIIAHFLDVVLPHPDILDFLIHYLLHGFELLVEIIIIVGYSSIVLN
jgi:hypothetical protein